MRTAQSKMAAKMADFRFKMADFRSKMADFRFKNGELPVTWIQDGGFRCLNPIPRSKMADFRFVGFKMAAGGKFENPRWRLAGNLRFQDDSSGATNLISTNLIISNPKFPKRL